MKRIIFSSLFVLVATSFSSAQNLKIIYASGPHGYYNDSTIDVYGSSAVNLFASPNFYIINQGVGAYLHCERSIISVLPGTSNAFCFAGACGSTSQNSDLHFDSCYIPAGDTANGFNTFYGDYYPAGQNGSSYIRYTFFNANYADSGSFIVKYITTTTGVAQIAGRQTGFSIPYPNPANCSVSFTYSLANGLEAANLKVFNLLGECVQNIPVSSSKNKATIDVQSMPSGIYVCEMEAAGCQPAYRKLIVAH